MMASKFRYVDDIVQAKAILASGLIGNVLFYENCFSCKMEMAGRWNADPNISGGGVLIDNGTHSVDIARFFLGHIKEVGAEDRSVSSGMDVEDTVQISFVTENNSLHTGTWQDVQENS